MRTEPPSGGRPSAREIAAVLAELYGREFGGARTGKYRISRKFLRQVAGRRRLTPELIDEIGDELFEHGFVMVDLESFFAVLHQRLFNSYRRVTSVAVGQVSGPGRDVGPTCDRDGSSGQVRSTNVLHDRTHVSSPGEGDPGT
jgi:hypothetical protein